MKKPSQIIVVSDGRQGHENQSVGLAEALHRRTGIAWKLVSFEGLSLFKRIKALGEAISSSENPLVIGTGHRTHLPMVWQRWRRGITAVVIMRPSLPLRFFDLAVIPRHDGEISKAANRVIRTFGALNRIPETLPEKDLPGMILLGGPSRHHGWEEEALASCLGTLLRKADKASWLVTDSRRTPNGFRSHPWFSQEGVEFCPQEKTAPGWLPGQLLRAGEVWVTEDSMSMIYEALTAGARVGILPMPRLNPQARVVKSVEDLRQQGRVVSFADWEKKGFSDNLKEPFHETGRVADEIVRRYFGASGKGTVA